MGKRREPRKAVAVPVRIFGTDKDGKVFSENVTTIDVSHSGVKLGGVRAQLRVEEIIGVTSGKNKVHFRVKWVAPPGMPGAGTIGLLNLTPEKPLWDFALPQDSADGFLPQHSPAQRQNERRQWPRVKCSISVELRRAEQPVIWGKASDLGQGGCFVEIPIPLPADTKFDIALWLGEIKLHLEGQVASIAPGFGNGVRFLNVSAANREQLRRFIDNIGPQQRGGILPLKHSGA